MFKNVLGRLVISLIALFVSLLLVEGLIRTFFPQELIYLNRSEIWEPDDVFGWKLRSNVSADINSGERKIHFATDEQGFRVGKEKITSPTYTILALGDSFIEGQLVEHEETVTGRLESLLSEYLAITVRVVNAGVAGWGPNQYLLRTERELERENYDLVVVFVYIENDLVTERHESFEAVTWEDRHHFRLPRTFSQEEFIDAVFYPMNDILETRSVAFVVLKKRLKVLLWRLGVTPFRFPEVFFLSDMQSVRYEVTTAISADIEKIASEHGIETLFVLIPSSLQVQEKSYQEYIQGFHIDPDLVDTTQPNRLLKEEFERVNLSVIDSLTEMQKIYKTKGVLLYDRINDHFTVAGHEALAAIVVPVLKETLLGLQ